MNTFLPYPDFSDSARALDRARLGKQRLECKQILRALNGETRGWVGHPAVKMWRHHGGALCLYAIAICDEWITRGYKDAQRAWFELQLRSALDTIDPTWLGDAAFHASHRSNLLRKDPEWYGRFAWTEPPDMAYVWPS